MTLQSSTIARLQVTIKQCMQILILDYPLLRFNTWSSLLPSTLPSTSLLNVLDLPLVSMPQIFPNANVLQQLLGQVNFFNQCAQSSAACVQNSTAATTPTTASTSTTSREVIKFYFSIKYYHIDQQSKPRAQYRLIL